MYFTRNTRRKDENFYGGIWLWAFWLLKWEMLLLEELVVGLHIVPSTGG
jgi:hypothetical protein